MLEKLNFRFDNGLVRLMTEDGAKRYAKDNRVKILNAWEADKPEPRVHRVRDGFQPGWNIGLGMYVSSREMYQRILKERGLIEVGREKPKDHEHDVRQIEKKNWDECFTDSNLRQMANDVGGLSLTDGDIRRLKDSN